MRKSGNTIILFAVFNIVLSIATANLHAVADTSARGLGFFRKDGFVREAQHDDRLSKAIAHYMMGIIYDNKNDNKKASEEYREAIKIEPDVSYIHTRLAVDYILLKDEEKALVELGTAERLDPADTKPKFLTALTYTSLGRFAEAQKKYEEVTKLDPQSVWALSSLADVLVLQKKLDEAATIYEKLIAASAKSGDSSVLYFNLAVIYSRTGKVDEAIAKLKEAIKLDPTFSEAYNYLGYLFAERGTNLDEAIVLIKRAIELSPANGAYIDSLGWAYFQKGMFAEALVELEKASQLEPDEPEITEHLKKAKEKLKK